MKVVLDTNVLLAGFATRGLCEAVMAACLEAHDVAVSEYILSELASHLASKVKLPEEQCRQIVTFLREQCQVVTPIAVPPGACPDADDLPILGTAVASGADCLVTGDKSLLALRSYEGIPILNPRSFHERMKHH